MPKIQTIGTSAFIYKSGKVLMVKRAKTESPFPGNWEIPGGRVEFGEDTETAIKRETKEETNLKIKVKRVYSVFSDSWNKNHYVSIQYLCRPLTAKIKLSDEHDEYLWATKKEVEKMKMTEKMRTAILEGFDFIK